MSQQLLFCPVCNKEYKSKRGLEQHMKNKHPIEEIKEINEEEEHLRIFKDAQKRAEEEVDEMRDRWIEEDKKQREANRKCNEEQSNPMDERNESLSEEINGWLYGESSIR